MVKEKAQRKSKPAKDYKGKLCVSNQMSRAVDGRYPTNDPRYKVATLHQHLTSTGEAGYSGKYDPKMIRTPEGIEYTKILEEDSAACELCESGDAISPWKRHLYSRYRPGERTWHRAWRLARIAFGKIRAIIRL